MTFLVFLSPSLSPFLSCCYCRRLAGEKVGGVSWLSEGEVPNPVHSPGLVAASIPARLSTLIVNNGSTCFSLRFFYFHLNILFLF